jgi:hypothetical protein
MSRGSPIHLPGVESWAPLHVMGRGWSTWPTPGSAAEMTRLTVSCTIPDDNLSSRIGRPAG